MQSSKSINNSNEAVFRDYSIPKAVATMAIPTVIGQMVVLIYNLADTFFIGRTANPYMVASASLVLPVFNIASALSAFIGLGGGSLISRLMGAQRHDEAKKVSAFTLYFSILVGLLWSILIACIMKPMLKVLGASPETFDYARQYATCVIVIGGIPTIVQLTCSQLLRSVGCSKQAGFGVSMGGVLNMILDPIFMFWVLPKGQEIIGAGIATLLSNVISLIYFLVMIYRVRKTTALTFSVKLGLPKRNNLTSLFANGFPAGLSNLLFDVSQIMINKLMSGYGDIPLAAIGIVLKAERIPLNVGVGLCQGIIPIVAYNYAAKKYDRMKETIRFSRICGLVVAAVAIVLYELFAHQIMVLFINEPQTTSLGADFLRARCLATPFMFMAFHLLFSFQAMGKAGTSLMLAVVRQLVLYIPILFLMNVLFGMYGLVWAQLVGDILTDLFSFWMFARFWRTVKAKVSRDASVQVTQ